MTLTLPSSLRIFGLIIPLVVWHSFSFATDISDNPLPVVSSAAPNIMFMIDDSGSMDHIVEDAPYNSATTYLDCASVFPDGATSAVAAKAAASEYSLRIKKSDGTASVGQTTGVTATAYVSFNSAANTCFSPALYYRVTSLNTSCGGTNCDSLTYPGDGIYKGNYLNWYFGDPATSYATAANFGASATRKPGTSTRLEIVKTAANTVITGLDKVRIGLFGYNGSTGGTLKQVMGDLDSAKRTAMTTAINGVTASGRTPLAETLSDIGRYFTTGTTSTNLTLHPGTGSSATATIASIFNNHSALNSSGVASLPAPVQYYCQKSFAIMMTDGVATDDQAISTSLQEYYGYCTANPDNCTDFGMRKKLLDTAGNPTAVDEYYEPSVKAPSDYLDDVANALYDIDLRPDLAPPSPATKTSKNNLSTYTIGFADPMLDATSLLERAAKYGGGLALSASNATTLAAAFTAATDDILAKDGSAAAVAVANAHVTNTDNASYATSYNSGVWSGDLIAYPINTTTGVPNINTPIWNTGCTTPTAYVDPSDTTKGVLGCSAQTLLDLKTSATRKIFTSNDTSTCFYNCGIPFQPTTAAGTLGVDKVSTAQQTLLNTPTLTDGAAVINYFRGVRSGETAGTYRSRAHLLGDTVNAEPLVIREPDRNYIDAGYSTYKSSNDNRTRIILQPANDGMVHAFNSLTGVEEWAYVPNLLISNAKDPNSSSTSLLNTRSRKASFNHYFLVDGTPVVGDVDFANSGTTGVVTTSWGTIAVGGLGKGGRGYYALNVTSTTTSGANNTEQETSAAAKALWEFPRSITDSTKRARAILDMGYSFGKPIIVKTTAAGWVVLVTSGYNNGTNTGDSGGDGLGHLFVLNAQTGDLIADLKTTGCKAAPTTTPCGLSSVNAYVENRDKDNTVEIAYGGDLYGNLYRFDLRGTTVASWSVSKMAQLRSGPAVTDPVQPITTTPELAKITVSGANKYMVYVGTGLYLGKTDLPCPPSPATCTWTPNSQSTQTQTMYALVDARGTSTLPDPLLGNLVAQTYTTSGTTRTFSNNTIDYSTKEGWYVNFTGGERLVTDPALASGALIFTSNNPSTTACIPGGSSYLYAVNYKTGGRLTSATPSGISLGSALASRPVLIQLPNGGIKAIVRLSDTTTVTTGIPVTTTPVTGRRVSWRELFDK